MKRTNGRAALDDDDLPTGSSSDPESSDHDTGSTSSSSEPRSSTRTVKARSNGRVIKPIPTRKRAKYVDVESSNLAATQIGIPILRGMTAEPGGVNDTPPIFLLEVSSADTPIYSTVVEGQWDAKHNRTDIRRGRHDIALYIFTP